MRGMKGRCAAAFAVVSLLAGLFAGAAVGETRNRALERLLEHSLLTAGEGTEVARAFSAAAKAGADERELLQLVEACVDGEFEAAQTLRLLALAGQLAVADLPLRAFTAKIEEGVAKRVPAERVVQAAATRAVMLAKARSAVQAAVLEGLSRSDGDELLADVAGAFEAGRSAEEVREIFAAALAAGDGVGAIRRRLFP